MLRDYRNEVTTLAQLTSQPAGGLRIHNFTTPYSLCDFNKQNVHYNAILQEYTHAKLIRSVSILGYQKVRISESTEQIPH